jgi:hypothetical protein
MKIQQSGDINPFGGINFVYEDFDKLALARLFEKHLPCLYPNSHYQWKDILYSLFSIYLCGGSAIEDINSNLGPHLAKNPYCKIPSADTLLRRIASLAEPDQYCTCARGSVTHQYNTNERLSKLNMILLKHLGAFNKRVLTLDYDNTIVYNEKADSVLTYKKQPGYQPGVCTLNTHQILYLENRNGNSDAKAFQEDTLSRLFDTLEAQGIKQIDHFRADAASYQYKVVKLLKHHVKYFYIAARKSYVEKYFSQITQWKACKDSSKETIWIGDMRYIPFVQSYPKDTPPETYRLVVKRKPNKSRQVDLITQDAFEYTAIITNDFDTPSEKLMAFYNQRGAMEKQFDILKNDFAWKHLPFSTLAKNTVFLVLMAICRNLYHSLIQQYAKRFKGIKANFRVKRFIFKIIIIPAKWIYRARENKLRIYANIAFKT